MQSSLAPIVLFVYNRPWHTTQCLESLAKNELANESILYVYADGLKENPTEEDLKKINDVQSIISSRSWCKEVHLLKSQKNNGLANSVIKGVTEIVNKYGKIIVLEDDLVLSKGFLKYMNDALNFYEKEEKVMHISGYMFPVKAKLQETFFYNSTSCWGWGTWKEAWKYFNLDATELWTKINESGRMEAYTLSNTNGFDTILLNSIAGKNSSWATRWYSSVFLKNGLCLHPNKSLVRNIGYDDDGKHCKKGWWSEIYTKQKMAKKIQIKPIATEEYTKARDAVKKFYEAMRKPPLRVKAIEKLKLILAK